MSVPVVQLTWPEASVATHVATMRQLSNIWKNRKHRHGADESKSWDMHIAGCFGELAAAKHTNLFWSGAVGDMDARDVGGLIDVRAVSESHYSLLLHDDDPDDTPFVMAWPNMPSVTLFGWLLAKDGKKSEFWKDPKGGRPAFFIPQRLLLPIPALFEWIRERTST